MRITPVKTKPIPRKIKLGLLLRGVGLRVKWLHDDLDVWLLESAAAVSGSHWERMWAYGSGLEQPGSSSVVHIVAPEAFLRFDAIYDYFGMLRSATRTRSAYSLYVLSRSTIEACAFASWVTAPGIGPAERLLRGLLLRERSMKKTIALITQEIEQGHRFDDSAQDHLVDINRSKGELARRAACWGIAYSRTRLNRVVRRIEHGIEGEPAVVLV